MQDSPKCCTSSVVIGQKAFSNYNGIGIHLCYSPQPTTTSQWPSQHVPRQMQQPPPPMLAVVLDASMADNVLQAAIQSLTQALSQLNPQTRLLLVVYDQVVKMIDLKCSRAQAWIVHGLNSPGAAILPQIVRAADIRATPLAHCQPFLSDTLAALRHYPHLHSIQHHLRITAAAVDIALFLLTASVAAWDAQHKPQQQRRPPQTPQQQQQTTELQPMHDARVMLLTSLPNSSASSPASAQQLMQQIEQQQAQHLQQMFAAIATKAASLDIPLDVITGSLASPAAMLLQDAVIASHGRLLHQPGLKPPLASNMVTTAQSRFGWEGVLDVRVPHGVKVVTLSGPVSPNQGLPKAAYLSGSEVPVTVGGTHRRTASSGGFDGTASPPLAIADAAATAAAAAGAATGSLSSGPIAWSNAASAVPVMSSGSRFVAVLELTQDWQPGSSIEVQVVAEWTSADGKRVRQVISHTINITDRLTPYIEGLDVPAVVLLMSQRLVAAIATAAVPKTGAALRVAAPPRPRSIEEGRLSVGMALAHVAQRLGHAHTSRRGMFGFGSQQVWQLPDNLIPLAISLYQLQRSSILDLDPAKWGQLADQTATGSSTDDPGSVVINNSDSTTSSSSNVIMYGSWRVQLQQFMNTGPDTALRMVAPWLYVYDSSSEQFEVLPPLNLALEPDALAVLDCGSELLIYVGQVLEAMVGGLASQNESDEKQELQQQKKQQQQRSAAAAAAGPGVAPAESAAAAGDGAPAVPDMAVAAAPAVQCAQQLIRGRVPVPAIRLIQGIQDMADMMQKLVPLHEDPVALQLLLLPHLKDLSPAQHGYLLDWHRHWAAVAAGAASTGSVGYASGGARLAVAERDKSLSFGQWYSSYGVVLRSPGGTVEIVLPS